MNPLEEYLREMAAIRASGQAVKETSYYGPLSNLLNEIGKTLKPKVRCIIHIKNEGAGIPDGGFFTAEQVKRVPEAEPLSGPLPARGAIEVKAPSDDAWDVAGSNQVAKYCKRYGQVLVTTYRDFVLVSQTPEGKVVKLENYILARKESDFWNATVHPHRAATRHAGPLIEYLKRVMLNPAPLTEPKDVAWFLASYARDALCRIEHASLPALDALRVALEEALGLKFEGEKGDHFFRSTLVQTLFYGVFSAWVLWSKEHPPGTRPVPFAWQMAAWSLRVPMIKALFEQLTLPTKLAPLNLVEVLDWTAATLNRVDRAQFFQKFEEAHAVQYFYEPFVEAFDPKLRKELGVWYTPDEVVRYMVARVDTVLREELEIADGLADPRVYVLDPCCGTGTFLVEALKRIEQTLREQRGDALIGDDLKKAAQQRVFGFEILPAPFVVSHLQLGLLLQNLGAPLADDGNERIGVFLTNSLTGWEPPSDEAKARLQQLAFAYAELREEHDAADKVKREAPILVVLGNPPYNGFAGVAVEEERDLSDAYRTTKRAPAPQGQGLNDLYVRFFRMAERRIVEQSGRGVVCFISNYSWLDGLSFTGMRERYLEVFDRVWIDCLNGDKYKTGKLTPDGQPDPSIFSTEWNREGIQVGTAIALFVRREAHVARDAIRFRHVWGKTKRQHLLETALQGDRSLYSEVQPPLTLGFPYLPAQIAEAYSSWPLLPQLFPVCFPGVKTSRDDALVDIDRDRLVERMTRYLDPQVSDEDIRRTAASLMISTKRFNAPLVRKLLLRRGFLERNVVRYCYRPFDIRWLYWEPKSKLLDEKRAEYFPHVREGNLWLSAGQRNRMDKFYQPQFTGLLADHHIVESNVSMFPLHLYRGDLLSAAHGAQPNLSSEATAYISELGCQPQEIFYHSLAVLHAPAYRTENMGALRQDWPRIPLSQTRVALLSSAELGRGVAALLDPEAQVTGVTSGAIRLELRLVAVVSRVGGGSLKADAGDLTVSAGWGHPGKGGVTMPGKGKVVEREYTAPELTAIQDGAKGLGLTEEQVLRHLGERTCDVYLNAIAYWRNVPLRVWEYTIGGYQVIKKWLSYREHAILGRTLQSEEAREVTNIARRIAAILLLEPALDANYEAVKQSAYQWPLETQPRSHEDRQAPT
jgi:hypothetical protein